MLLNAGADPIVQGSHWVHFTNNPRSRKSGYGKPSKIDLSRILIRNRKQEAEETNAQIRQGHVANREVRFGSVTKLLTLLPEQLRTRRFWWIAGSSETHNAASDLLSTLRSMLRRLHNTVDFLPFWRRSFFGMPSRRQLNRLLRPRVPQDHVRLTWICVSCPLK